MPGGGGGGVTHANSQHHQREGSVDDRLFSGEGVCVECAGVCFVCVMVREIYMRKVPPWSHCILVSLLYLQLS